MKRIIKKNYYSLRNKFRRRILIMILTESLLKNFQNLKNSNLIKNSKFNILNSLSVKMKSVRQNCY